MKNLMSMLTIIVLTILFTGCFGSNPEPSIVEKKSIKFIEPNIETFAIIETPVFDDSALESDDPNLALDYTIKYAIQLGSVIKKYESRISNLEEWFNKNKIELKKIYPELIIEEVKVE